MVFNLCTSSDDALYLYQVSRKYLIGFHSYWADMICILKFTKGHNFVKTVDEDMVLALCTSADNALNLCKGLWKYLKGFQSNRPEQVGER